MSHIVELAEQLGINEEELFSGKYGDSYDEILDKLMEMLS